MDEQRPGLAVRPAHGEAAAVALVLHGGAEHGLSEVRPWRLAYLRMVPFVRALAAAGGRHGLEVRLLRNRVRGWNEPACDPLRDARWALERIHAERPGLPVVLVGHSMGGRVALRAADDPAVLGVCALAPWTPRGEPVEPVAARSVLIAHGLQDRVTKPGDSYHYAVRAAGHAADVARFELAAEGHAMLRRAGVWTRLVVEFVARTLALPGAGATLLDAAWTKPEPERLRIPL
ncbi:alpha/beta hydrolase [Prauserella muralis]|uniref:Alpha/beta hydrolase n=1 Tax=Prauserella muralis TaxID=588067 RepID=A0A2V4AHQ6_9PSEU|nr:alpha/beta fold hydrolase [Prauserella muralis]PXY19100.1 alpha/beta hydrolase [Prauserella muralis]TWE29003.1 alpha/beta hydrolase family protein [Prauserella muralis]